MSEIKAQLSDMGFSSAQIENALTKGNAKTLEEAMDWIVSQQEVEAQGQSKDSTGPDQDESNSEHPKALEGNNQSNDCPVEAKSITCNECGKRCRTEADVQFHAAKSGHTDFAESIEEIKPLSEEERQAKVEELQSKLKEKRELIEEEERKKAKDMERKRREQGQELALAKQRLQEKEMKEIAEERKRQKREDLLAKQRVLNQIKADREAKEKEESGSEVPPAEPTIVQPSVNKPDYQHCKIQVRLPDGKTLTHTFGAQEELSAVRLYVQMNQAETSTPIRLMTNFPKKVFTEDDMATPLKVLGLVPSSVLIASNAPGLQ